MKEVKTNILERGVRLVHNEGKWSISNIIYADDAVLING